MKRPYSICFDESTVNKTSQLDINASVINDANLIEKSNFTSVHITEGYITVITIFRINTEKVFSNAHFA